MVIAVVIPYFKLNYFKNLLDALSYQSNSNFKVYVGDDCSPDCPVKRIEEYKNKLNIVYKKFEKNIGHTSLTRHWERCVELIEDEEWVWILPDDDLPSKNCVEEFYKALPVVKEKNIRVFRFPLKRIDGHGKIINHGNEDNPEFENNFDFYTRILKGKTSSSLGDNIFSRKHLNESGGFVDFPKAWGSDHATVLNVSSKGNIYYLDKAVFYFRMSGENISSDNSDGVIKLKSRILFAKWLKRNEHIFPSKPNQEFYQFFYWKGEYYVLNEWGFSLHMLVLLYQLRRICFRSRNILPIVKVVLKKCRIIQS